MLTGRNISLWGSDMLLGGIQAHRYPGGDMLLGGIQAYGVWICYWEGYRPMGQ